MGLYFQAIGQMGFYTDLNENVQKHPQGHNIQHILYFAGNAG